DAYQSSISVGMSFGQSFTYLSGYLSEISADGSTLIYSSYFGGSAVFSAGGALSFDLKGNLYVTGSASPGLPTTGGSFMTQISGDIAAFVSVFDLSKKGSSQLVAATYYGSPHQNGETLSFVQQYNGQYSTRGA